MGELDFEYTYSIAYNPEELSPDDAQDEVEAIMNRTLTACFGVLLSSIGYQSSLLEIFSKRPKIAGRCASQWIGKHFWNFLKFFQNYCWEPNYTTSSGKASGKEIPIGILVLKKQTKVPIRNSLWDFFFEKNRSPYVQGILYRDFSLFLFQTRIPIGNSL